MNLTNPNLYNPLLNLGVGLLSQPTIGRGLFAGLNLAQQAATLQQQNLLRDRGCRLKTYGKKSRQLLTNSEVLHFLAFLQEQPAQKELTIGSTLKYGEFTGTITATTPNGEYFIEWHISEATKRSYKRLGKEIPALPSTLKRNEFTLA